MATYFFDSSAILKRYLSETGTVWVTSIADTPIVHRIHVASITGAEVVAAIARRRLGGSISAADAATHIAEFGYDFVNQYRIADITDTVISRAMVLADKHSLRGYDSVQLAAALELNDRRLARRWPVVTLVSTDTELNIAATAEGLTVEDHRYPHKFGMG